MMGFRAIAAAAAGVAAIFLAGAAAQSPVSPTKPAAAPAGQPLSSAPAPAAASAASATPPAAGAAGRTLDRADLEAWLDGVVPYALDNGDIAGAVVVVVKDGQVLLQKGYGYSDVAKKTPMDPERTLVRPGSTSKLFTWTAVMQLVEQGKLDLDRDVNDYLDFKVPVKFGKPVTLRDLMNHRGGFEEGLKDVLYVDPKGAPSTEAYLKAHPRPMLYKPGEVPAYSNYGTALAGYIVQRVSGEPFERYVERHIFQPLGMTSSSFDQPLPERLRGRVANGYRTKDSEPYGFEIITTGPAGALSSSASDMARFMLAHLQQGRTGDGQILTPQTTELMHSPSETGLTGFATMAHGFFHETHNGRLMIGHGGDTVVFHTEMDLLPSEGVGIFYSFNSRGKGDAVYGARSRLIDGFLDRYFPAPAEAAAAPALASAKADAQEIAGTYQSSRRVEHGFLTLFYILQQSKIVANGDGTISAANSMGSGLAKFREVGPQLWREIGGDGQLALKTVGGVKTVVESSDPTSVMQAVPPLRASSLNLTILMASVAILAWTLLLWPLAPFLRWGDRARSDTPAEARRLRLFSRGSALLALAYLTAWVMVLQPILSSTVQFYTAKLDGVVLTLEIAGFVVALLAAVCVWVAWRTFRLKAPWTSRIWSILVAAAMIGVVWVGAMGGLIGVNLNY